MCHVEHTVGQCSRFIQSAANDRWTMVKDSRRCFSCLQAGHSMFACPSRRQCGIARCSMRHHPLLYEEPTVDNPITGTSALPVGSLYKYVPVMIVGMNGCKKVLAFIDDGSKVSLLSERVAKDVNQRPRHVALVYVDKRDSVSSDSQKQPP